ncbi:uncharacterized protein G2W53_022718 [Senna tora]|uniref:Uncharacterized protein n=1 Tax=Senna tora TaxID=362788 RepID=A0A834TND4_9FABA|nr:uncharacterized protein G2W53_022718 [Senna tora]
MEEEMTNPLAIVMMDEPAFL